MSLNPVLVRCSNFGFELMSVRSGVAAEFCALMEVTVINVGYGGFVNGADKVRFLPVSEC